MKTVIKNISFTRGDTYTFKVTLKNSNLDITGAILSVKDNTEKIVFVKNLENGIVKEDNSFIITIKPVDTEELNPTIQYSYDLQLDYGIDDSFTPVKGLFEITWDCTCRNEV